MFQKHLVERKTEQYAFQLKEKVRFSVRKRGKMKSEALLQPLPQVFAAADSSREGGYNCMKDRMKTHLASK